MKIHKQFLSFIKGFQASSILLFLLFPMSLCAQQQQTGWCAQIKMEIPQELSLERIGFEATLEVTNNTGVDPITDFSAQLTFKDPSKTDTEESDDAASLFFVRTPSLEDVTSIKGDGTIGAGNTAIIKWFIIPKISAGGESQLGKPYEISAVLSGNLAGVEIPDEMLEVIPETIVVKPEPQLAITYFQPRDVQGDDPFTVDVVESPIPFTLGVLVKNDGFGIAREVKIDSKQPKIIENKQKLLIVAQLLGTRVMDSALDEADLLVDLGDLDPGDTKKAAWDMITSLSGEFIEFKAYYKHAAELGGEETSVIKSLEAHFIAHEVLNDQSGRDSILDFLADVDRDEEMLPDTLYESDGNILPVNIANESSVGELSAGSATVLIDSGFEGWIYSRLDDPAQASYPIKSVTRSDGKLLSEHNVWTNIRYAKEGNEKLTYLNILDFVDNEAYTYQVEYDTDAEDTEAPVTRLRFAGPSSTSGLDTVYITPETQLYFTSVDMSPVSILYRLDDGVYVPALPFSLDEYGTYSIDYYASDANGNVETASRMTIICEEASNKPQNLLLSSDELYLLEDLVSVRAGEAEFSFSLPESSVSVDTEVEIFSGIIARPVILNSILSPSAVENPTFVIGGEFVDYYKYRLNEEDWSEEFSVSESLSLSSLTGSVSLSVLGRHENGIYAPESEALSVSWDIDSSAPLIELEGLDSTPTEQNSFVLSINNTEAELYRWTIDGGYYRAEAALTESFELDSLDEGEHTISVICKESGVWQDEAEASHFSFLVDTAYAYDCSYLSSIEKYEYPSSEGQSLNQLIDPAGLLKPGNYTIRVKTSDELGNENYALKLLTVNEAVAETENLADLTRGATNPDASNGVIVWQERLSGTWNIAMRSLKPSDSNEIQLLSQSEISQVNPHTDGRMVTWQGQQANGSWDIYWLDLEDPDTIQQLTDTQALNETNPQIDWPWLVYEKQMVDESDASQVFAVNLETNQIMAVDSSVFDQESPALHGSKVVWTDYRNVGVSEIYFSDLEQGDVLRITNNTNAQFQADIFGDWIVWKDNRNTQIDLWGYNLKKGQEEQLTETDYNETEATLMGDWLVFAEDSYGLESLNFKLMNLSNKKVVPVTSREGVRSCPTLAQGSIVWQEGDTSESYIESAELSSLQVVFENNNILAITEDLLAAFSGAHELLNEWHDSLGLISVTKFTAIDPHVVSVENTWDDGPDGVNFSFDDALFLMLRFEDSNIIDMGLSSDESFDLEMGVNVLNYSNFPLNYSSHDLCEELGTDVLKSLRIMNAQSGHWEQIEVIAGEVHGPEFIIPRSAVLFLDLGSSVSDWKPGVNIR